MRLDKHREECFKMLQNAPATTVLKVMFHVVGKDKNFLKNDLEIARKSNPCQSLKTLKLYSLFCV
jgi:hypothetical protein